MPANSIFIATSCGPTSRRVIVVLVSGSVADVAAYAETVLKILTSHRNLASLTSIPGRRPPTPKRQLTNPMPLS